MFSGIGVIIAGYNSLFPINIRYWTALYLPSICIAKKITYKVTNQ